MSENLREPALFVGDIEDAIDLELPPSSGEEYIKRVVIEAKRCEDVVVAEISKARLKTPTVAVKPLAGCIEAPASIGPTLDWQRCQLADFSSLRLDIAQMKSDIVESRHLRGSLEARLPDLGDQEGWLNFCLNTHRPLLRVILSMNQPLVEQVLEYLVEAVEDKKEIGQGFGEWIFGLLVALELPLTPDTCSCLRSLARACSIIRANMVETNVKEIAALNLFICLVARYFRQMDLVDS